MPPSLFIFGLGYTTTGVARQAQQLGWHVTSTSRQPERFERVAVPGRHTIVRFDPAANLGLDPAGVDALRGADYVVSSIPPVASSLYNPVLAAQRRLLRDVAAGRHTGVPHPQGPALGYLSSTGVYGDWAGQWVDESSEARSATARGLLRLEAEEAWAALARELQLQLTVFRLGGIYGPQRSVLSSVQAGAGASSRSSVVRRSRQRFTSRCHVADVAQAVLADMQRQHTRAVQQQQQQQVAAAAAGPCVDVINVVDDEPAPRGQVEAFARGLLMPPPAAATPPAVAAASQPQQVASDAAAPSVEAAAGQPPPPPTTTQEQQAPRRRQRLDEPLEEKRVRNSKLKGLLQEQLAAGLIAPTFREGLRMLAVEADLQPFAPDDLRCLFGDAVCEG